MSQRRNARNSVRIIGGKWRGRKVSFPDAGDLRPTPDRVRETLFNWLQSDIPGARCLELFGGSGALSLEALSRSAASVTVVDQNPAVTGHLAREFEVLTENDDASFNIVTADASDFLDQTGECYDVVFLDPPFSNSSALISSSLTTLLGRGLLDQDAIIYIESGAPLAKLDLPAPFCLVKDKRAGSVHFGLCHADE